MYTMQSCLNVDIQGIDTDQLEDLEEMIILARPELVGIHGQKAVAVKQLQIQQELNRRD